MSTGALIDAFMATAAPAAEDIYASRREWKYVAPEAIAERLRAQVAERLAREEFVPGRPITRVHSIYLDDADFNLYQQCLLPDETNLKFRIRTYAYPDGTGEATRFFEYKAGLADGQTRRKRKQRVRLTDARLGALLDRSVPLVDTDRKRWGPVQAFVRGMRLVPRLTVTYLREAFVSDDGRLRITFDTGYRASKVTENLTSPLGGLPRLLSGYMVIEVKHLDGLPDWFTAALVAEGLSPVGQAFSKFKTAVALLYPEVS